MNHRNNKEFGTLALVMDGLPLPEVHGGFHAIKMMRFPVFSSIFFTWIRTFTVIIVRTPDLALRPWASGYPFRFSTGLLSSFVVWRQNKVLTRLKSLLWASRSCVCLRVVRCRFLTTCSRVFSQTSLLRCACTRSAPNIFETTRKIPHRPPGLWGLSRGGH